MTRLSPECLVPSYIIIVILSELGLERCRLSHWHTIIHHLCHSIVYKHFTSSDDLTDADIKRRMLLRYLLSRNKYKKYLSVQEPLPYKFEYSVHDTHTGDVKEAAESRHGDQVKGFYMLKEADGTTREVHYTADKHNGFQVTLKNNMYIYFPGFFFPGQENYILLIYNGFLTV